MELPFEDEIAAFLLRDCQRVEAQVRRHLGNPELQAMLNDPEVFSFTRTRDPLVMARNYDLLAGIAERLVTADIELHAKMIAELAWQIDRAKAKLVIDAGCGVGLPLAWLAGHFTDVAFLGYDLSPISVLRACTRIIRYSPRVRVVVAEHGTVSGVAPPADLVYLKQAHFHPEQLATVGALLRVGGLLIVMREFKEEEFEEVLARGRIFGFTEEPAGRRLIESRQMASTRRDPQIITDMITLRKTRAAF